VKKKLLFLLVLTGFSMGIILSSYAKPANPLTLLKRETALSNADTLYYEKKSYSMAAEEYQKASDLGSVEAKYLLGMMYLSGKGIKKSSTKGVSLIEEAAGYRNANAQHVLGFLTLYGQDGVKQNNNKGLELIKLAAGQRNDTAMFDVGRI